MLHLFGHILATAVLFLFVASIAWALGVAITFLNSKHPFHPGVLSALHTVEIWLLYIDILMSGMLLLVGAFRFLRDITGDRL